MSVININEDMSKKDKEIPEQEPVVEQENIEQEPTTETTEPETNDADKLQELGE